MSLVAMIGTIAHLAIGRLKERDKLAFDKDLLELKHKQAICEKENHWFRDQIAELKQRDAKDRAELQSEIAAVKEAVGK